MPKKDEPMVDVTISLDTEQYRLLAAVADENGWGDLPMSQLLSIRIDDEVQTVRRAMGGAQ